MEGVLFLPYIPNEVALPIYLMVITIVVLVKFEFSKHIESWCAHEMYDLGNV